MTPPARLLGVSRCYWVLVGMLPAVALSGSNLTIVDLPGPVLVAEIDSDRYRFQWVSGVGLVAISLGMCVSPWLHARFGLGRMFLGGLGVFMLGALLSGNAPGDTALAAARGVQAVGSGMLLAGGLSVLLREFPGPNRDWALGIYVVALMSGRLGATVASGLLVNAPDWRTVFLSTVPFAAFSLVVCYEALGPDPPPAPPHPPLDWPGLGLLAVVLVCGLVTVDRAQLWGWFTSPDLTATVVVGAVAAALFAARELTAARPLIPPRLFLRPRFAAVLAAKFLSDAAFFAVLGQIIRYMVVDRGYPRPTTGFVLMAAVAGAIAAALIGRYGTRRNRVARLVIGLAGQAAATWALAGVDLFTDKRWLAVILAGWGAAVGLANSPFTCLAMEDLTPEELAESGALRSLSLPASVVLGTGLVGILVERRADAIFDALRQTAVVNRPPTADVLATIRDRAAEHTLLPTTLPAQAEQVLGRWAKDNASVFAVQAAFEYLALVILAALVLAVLLWFLPGRRGGPERG